MSLYENVIDWDFKELKNPEVSREWGVMFLKVESLCEVIHQGRREMRPGSLLLKILLFYAERSYCLFTLPYNKP